MLSSKVCFLFLTMCLAVLAASLFAGCATGGNRPTGRIVGSVGIRNTVFGAQHSAMHVVFKAVGGSRKGAVSYVSNPFTLGYGQEIDTDEYVGSTFVKTLPAGDYEFIQYSCVVQRVLGRVRINRPLFGPRFRVRPGEVTYIGAWEASPITRRALGVERMSDGIAFLVDRAARDIPYIVAKDPTIIPSKIRRSTPDASNRLPGPVRSDDNGTEYLSSYR